MKDRYNLILRRILSLNTGRLKKKYNKMSKQKQNLSLFQNETFSNFKKKLGFRKRMDE
jgi:hypothetical protein